MKFEKLVYKNGCKLKTIVEYSDFKAAFDEMDGKFQIDDNVYAFEQKQFENGKMGLSLKDKSNKIIIQLKTI